MALKRRGGLLTEAGSHKSGTATATDWRRLRGLSGKEIRSGVRADAEAHATDVDFWKGAKVVLPQVKQTVTVWLDADLLEWLRWEKRYEARINAVLRSYMEAQRGEGSLHADIHKSI